MFILFLPPKVIAWFVAMVILIGLACGLVWSTAAYLHFHPLW